MNFFPLSIEPNHLLLVVTHTRESDGVTELIARLAVNGSFYFIAGGEWVPDQRSLRNSIRRHTLDVGRTLNNARLTRPSTCLQLVDLLAEVDSKNDPLIVLDFLHLFYNPDIDIGTRQRMVTQCCEQLRSLSKQRPVIVFVQQRPMLDDHECLFPIIPPFADEIYEPQMASLFDILQSEVPMGRNLPSAKMLAEQLKAEINSIGEVLAPSDRTIFKKFDEWILHHSAAIANSTDLDPMQAALTLLLLEEHKRMDLLSNDLYGWMRELEEKIAVSGSE